MLNKGGQRERQGGGQTDRRHTDSIQADKQTDRDEQAKKDKETKTDKDKETEETNREKREHQSDTGQQNRASISNNEKNRTNMQKRGRKEGRQNERKSGRQKEQKTIKERKEEREKKEKKRNRNRGWQVRNTWNVSLGSCMPTLSPNQVRVALTKSRRATKAMRLTAMLATSFTDCVAPLDAASMMLRSVLWTKLPSDFILMIRLGRTENVTIIFYTNKTLIPFNIRIISLRFRTKRESCHLNSA